MAADPPTASWTAPGFLLCLQETLHAIVANGVQICNHTHVVLRAVALIQTLQAFAGVLRAFKTEANLAFSQQLAAICHVGAVFPAGDAARAIGSVKAFFVQIHFFELVGCAQSAIHAAWSNQVFSQHFSRRLPSGT